MNKVVRNYFNSSTKQKCAITTKPRNQLTHIQYIWDLNNTW